MLHQPPTLPLTTTHVIHGPARLNDHQALARSGMTIRQRSVRIRSNGTVAPHNAPRMQTAATDSPKQSNERDLVSPALTPQAFSLHAQRRLVALLRLRLLELREQRLERVRQVIEKHLGVDALFSQPQP